MIAISLVTAVVAGGSLVVPATFENLTTTCAHELIADSDECKELRLVRSKTERVVALYNALKPHAVDDGSDFEYFLSPMDGILMDSRITAYLETPDGPVTDLISVAERSSFQFTCAVFQRYLDRQARDIDSRISRLITTKFAEAASEVTRLSKAAKASATELEELREEINARGEAEDLFNLKFKSIKKLMENYRAQADSQEDMYYTYFSMYKNMFDRRMAVLEHNSDESDIPSLVREVVDFLVSLASRGMNKRGLWKLCRQAYDRIGDAPEFLQDGMKETLADTARRVIADTEKVIQAQQQVDKVRQVLATYSRLAVEEDKNL